MKLLLTMIEAVIFALGVGVGLLGAHSSGSDPGAWLGFAGALIGAALTVLGALCVLEWQRTIEERSRRQLLVELLQEVLTACSKVRSPKPHPQLSPAIVQLVAVRDLEEAVARTQGARQWVQPDNAAMARAFSYIGKMSISRDQLEKESKADRFYDLASNLSRHLDVLETTAQLALADLRK